MLLMILLPRTKKGYQGEDCLGSSSTFLLGTFGEAKNIQNFFWNGPDGQ
jgi:hypothetical protein